MTEIAASQDAMRAAAAAWSRARILDDKLGDPDAARLAAWAESIERWRLLDVPDLVEAVMRFYEAETEGRTIQIGDLLHHGREIRRQRAEREKAAEVITAGALPAGARYEGLPINATGSPVRPAYDVGGAVDRQCPNCNAAVGDPCISAVGVGQRIPCLARMTGREAAVHHVGHRE